MIPLGSGPRSANYVTSWMGQTAAQPAIWQFGPGTGPSILGGGGYVRRDIGNT